MNLIQEIQNDILNPETQLAVILRKAKVLAYRLKNIEFKEWVNHELDGYDEKDFEKIPDYRKGSTHSLGNFAGPFGSSMRNMPIPTFNLPKGYQSLAQNFVLFQGTRVLESLLESKEPTFRINWPPDAAAVIGNEIYDGWFCVSAWKVIPRGIIEQVLDTVRNRLLSFILELEELTPDIGELPPGGRPPISDERVQQVFNTYILGGQNVLGSGVSSIRGELVIGDTFNMSGDFPNAILNIKSTLVNVRQSINTIPNADKTVKDELRKLVDQLDEELQKVPTEKSEEAEAVAESAKGLVESVNKEKPNKAMVQISADGLKQAAENLAAVTPIVSAIATQIVAAVMKISE